MSNVLGEVLAANAACAGLAEGDAHVSRNAGGRASDDAIRSLVISHELLGTREWLVVHHSDCGGFVYDVRSGRLVEVPRAMEIGRAA